MAVRPPGPSLKARGGLTDSERMFKNSHHTPVVGTYRLVTRSDFDGLVCAALLKELGILDDILFVHPKDVQDGKVELTANDITTNLPYAPRSRCRSTTTARRTSASPRTPATASRSPSADSAARVVYDYFGGAERFPRVSDGDDGGRRQGRRREVQRERDPRSAGLDPAQLPDGSAHRAGPLPRVPHLQLRADDAADRPLPRAQRRRDPRASGRRRARRALPRARRGGDRADPALLHGARARGRARPARRGDHPPDQSLHGLRAASPVHRLGPRPLGPAPAEHRVRGRPLDHRPLVDASTSAG